MNIHSWVMNHQSRQRERQREQNRIRHELEKAKLKKSIQNSTPLKRNKSTFLEMWLFSIFCRVSGFFLNLVLYGKYETTARMKWLDYLHIELGNGENSYTGSVQKVSKSTYQHL